MWHHGPYKKIKVGEKVKAQIKERKSNKSLIKNKESIGISYMMENLSRFMQLKDNIYKENTLFLGLMGCVRCDRVWHEVILSLDL